MNELRFSLILATVHRVKETERFLHSLSQQDYQGGFELIVIDQNLDRCLDGMVEQYRRHFPILHLHQNQPLLARARNLGLAHVQGDVVGFPDDDCAYEPDTLSRAAGFLAEHPERDGVVGNVMDLEREEEAILFYMPQPAAEITPENAWVVGMTAAFFLRAERIQGCRFDETIGPGTPWGCGEDTDFFLRCMDGGASFYFDPAIVIRHPTPMRIYSLRQLVRREYQYGRGYGYLMGKRRFPATTALWKALVEPFTYVPACVRHRRWKELALMPSLIFGRLLGYLGYLALAKRPT